MDPNERAWMHSFLAQDFQFFQCRHSITGMCCNGQSRLDMRFGSSSNQLGVNFRKAPFVDPGLDDPRSDASTLNPFPKLFDPPSSQLISRFLVSQGGDILVVSGTIEAGRS